VDTVLSGNKKTIAVSGRDRQTGARVAGYEIHLGRTDGPDCGRPLLDLEGRPDGAVSADGLVAGTYVHGLFAGDAFRRAFLERLGARSRVAYDEAVEETLGALACHLAGHLDLDRVLAIARSRQG
jgi:adenosylcobyric acid synthase